MTDTHRPSTTNAFDRAYGQLAHIWSDHQRLRRAGASIPELSRSSERLDEVRSAMWDWWHANRIEGVR